MILGFICSSSGYGTDLKRFVLANIASVEDVSVLLHCWRCKNPVFGSFGGEAYVTV